MRKIAYNTRIPVYNPLVFENFATKDESGLQVQEKDGFFHIKLDGFSIELSIIINFLYIISYLCPSHTIVELELLNLPISQADYEAIGEIFIRQSI